jgi:ketosteroid isomerase-like protein
LCLFFCLLLSVASGRADEAAATSQRITAVLQHQAEAWNAGDLPTFMETYWNSEKLSFSSGGHTTRGWQATLDRYRQRYPDRKQMGQLRFSDLEITTLGDTAAMVLGQWHLTRDAGRLDGNFTLVLRHFEGQWRIIHDHTSLAAQNE